MKRSLITVMITGIKNVVVKYTPSVALYWVSRVAAMKG